MAEELWYDVGAAAELAQRPLQQVLVGRTKVALSRSISQMDPADGMHTIYEHLVFWADVVLVATPIRWGAASSLFFKMAERLNTVQNQITIRNRVMLTNKVAGQMMQFFAELGLRFPQFPYVAHSRGWTAEAMERNVELVQRSEPLHDVARAVLDRCVGLAGQLQQSPVSAFEKSGRKASGLERRQGLAAPPLE